ncbi:MAG: type VI secretion system baseplate subunit TssG [Gammaproteobacteria bacterium]
MDFESGQRTDPLIKELMARPHRFGYFQTLRVLQADLERKYGLEIATKELELGTLLQIRPNISMACPPSDLHLLEYIDPIDALDERERYRLTVNFLGLYGVDSPLPDYYIEHFVHADEEENPQRQFLDVFHHRIYWLLYQSWRKYRYYMQYRDGTEVFSQRFYSLIGLSSEKSRNDLGFRAQKLLSYLGVLSRRVCSAQMAERVLSKLLKVNLRLQQFVPTKVKISPDQQLCLGKANSRLGQDTSLGEEVAHVGNAFRVFVGPLDWDEYHSFLPGGFNHRVLKAALGQMLHTVLDYDVDLSMQPVAQRRLVLGPENQCGLGCTTWLAADETAIVSATL